MIDTTIILFGYEGNNILGQLRTYGQLGYKPVLVIVSSDKKPYYVIRSKYRGDIINVRSNEEGLRIIIEKYSHGKTKAIISTDSDSVVSLLNDNYDRLVDSFYFFNSGAQGKLTPYLNKYYLYHAAEQCGFRTPKSETVKIGDLPQNLSYPIFTKAINSFAPNWKSSVFICNNESELIDAYSRLNGDTVLLQEYIKKKNEFILQGLCVNNGCDVFIPLEGSYFRVLPSSYSNYLFFQAYSGRCLNQLKSLLQTIGYNGIFEVEFLITDEDELVFLEINFRQTAWNHTFTNMGVCLEKVWLNSLVTHKIDDTDVCIIKQPWRLMNEFVDFKDAVVHGNVSLLEWINDVRRTDSFMIYDKSDIHPFISYLNRYLGGIICSTFRKITH